MARLAPARESVAVSLELSFTVGELGSLAVMYRGMNQWIGNWFFTPEANYGLITFTIGGAGFLFFRVLEVFDVWSRPGKINRRYNEIRGKVQASSSSRRRVQLAVFPTATTNAGALNLGIVF